MRGDEPDQAVLPCRAQCVVVLRASPSRRSDQLAPPRRSRSVRVRDGKAVVTDGPFAETKEVVGGFDILECDSLEEAVDMAAGHPVAQMGTIEVRPPWGN